VRFDASVKLGLATTRLKIDESASQVQSRYLENVHFTEEIHPLLMVGRANERIQSDLPLSDWQSLLTAHLRISGILIGFPSTPSGMHNIVREYRLETFG